jgi:hypothetical protein
MLFLVDHKRATVKGSPLLFIYANRPTNNR